MKLKCFALVARSRLMAFLVAALMLIASLGAGSASAQDGARGTAHPAAAASGAMPGVSLLSRGAGYGHRGGLKTVRALQRRLDQRGLYPGPIDGLYGPMTQGAVARFQRQQDLPTDGIVGPQTQHALRFPGTARILERGAGYDLPGGSRQVRALQRRLRAVGQYPGPIDGLYGPRTQAALERFERRHGLPANGIAGPQTLARLRSPMRPLAKPSAPGARQHRTPTRARPGVSTQGTNKVTGAPQARSRPRPASAPSARRPIGGHGQGHRGGREPDVVGFAVWAGILALLLTLGLWPFARRAWRRERPARRGPAGAGGPVGVAGAGSVSGTTSPPAATPEAQSSADRGTASDAGAAATAGSAGRPEVPVIGYVRASAESVNGHELKTQAEVIARECARRGLALLQVVHEREPDKAKAHNRPGFGYALRRISDGEAQGIVVSELAQLTRSATELGSILEWFTRSQARLIAVAEALDTGERDGRLAARTLVEVSAWERARLSERTRHGLQAARLKQRPNGRSAVGDHPELSERIIQMRNDGMTLKAIADQLNEEGIPTVRGGTQWRPSSVQTAIGYRRQRPAPLNLPPPQHQTQGEGH
jgi:peptidoglycan hydrolase-like protein with peptidoglycan-binding domain/DNA invertase Pin-like site-specific DNA recombinase